MCRTNMGIANKVCDFFEFWYYQYILVTALYMLESWERKLFSILCVRNRMSVVQATQRANYGRSVHVCVIYNPLIA